MRVQLGDIADIQIGYQVTGRASNEVGGSHLLVQTADVSGSAGLDWQSLARISPMRRDVARHELQDGDVLLLAKGARRLALVARRPPSRTIAVSTIYVIRSRDQALLWPEYLAWYLNEAAGQELASRELQSSTMPYVRKESLLDLPVALPDMERQRAIAGLHYLLRREHSLALELLDRRALLLNTIARRAAAGRELLV